MSTQSEWLESDNHESETEEDTNEWGKALIPLKTIKDRHKVVAISFVLFGIVGVVPWNFFITATEYWEYKFRDVSQHGPYDPSKRTFLQAKFGSYLSVASMIPAFLGITLCAFLSHKCSTHIKILLPLCIVVLTFVATMVFVKLDTDPWQWEFFYLTLATVVIMNGLISFFQANTLGIASVMGTKFVKAIMNGQAIGGILASLGRIITLFIDASDPTTSALYYFLIAGILTVGAIAAYLLVLRTKFYKLNYTYAVEDYKMEAINAEAQLPFKEIVKCTVSKIKCQAAGVILVFIVTLSVFPAIASLVISVNWQSPSPWNGKYFLPVSCFLLFNCGDFCGRFIANRVQLINANGLSMILICIIRMVYIPLFLFSNAHPRYYLPVLLNSDIGYIILICSLSVSNGYLATLCMIKAPQQVDIKYQNLAGILMALFMSFGISIGAVLSNVIVRCL